MQSTGDNPSLRGTVCTYLYGLSPRGKECLSLTSQSPALDEETSQKTQLKVFRSAECRDKSLQERYIA